MSLMSVIDNGWVLENGIDIVSRTITTKAQIGVLFHILQEDGEKAHSAVCYRYVSSFEQFIQQFTTKVQLSIFE